MLTMIKKKLYRFFRHNLGYKILALVLAVILWLVIVNIEDPEVTRTFTVAVEIENKNYLKDSNKLYEVLDGTDQITFSVTGNRSDLDDLTSSDFVATADLQDVDEETGKVWIQLSAPNDSDKINFNSESKSTDYLVLAITDMEEEEFTVSCTLDGEVADGYELMDISLNHDTITVYGAEDALAKIDSVGITLAIDDLSEDTDMKAAVTLYNRKGKEIDTADMNLSNKNIRAILQIGIQKTVPLTVKTTGKPLNGYTCTGTLLSATSVCIVGAEDVLESVDRIVLESSKLRLKEKSASYTTTLSIGDYLPDGVVLSSGSPETVEVTIQIEPEKETGETDGTADSS